MLNVQVYMLCYLDCRNIVYLLGVFFDVDCLVVTLYRIVFNFFTFILMSFFHGTKKYFNRSQNNLLSGMTVVTTLGLEKYMGTTFIFNRICKTFIKFYK